MLRVFTFLHQDSSRRREHPTSGRYCSTEISAIDQATGEGRNYFGGQKELTSNYHLEGELYGNLFPKASLTPVTISAGKANGVKRKMLFRLLAQPGPQYLKITHVRTNTATGVIIRDVDDDGLERFFDNDTQSEPPQKRNFLPIRVGAKVTTSPHF